MQEELILTVSASPHVKDDICISKIMYNVILALMPTLLMFIWYYGLYFIQLIVFSTISAVLSEAAMQYLLKKEITIIDGSAALTGLLLALSLPPNTPWWMASIGSSLAIILGKQIYGGLGHNPFNPALIGRVILLVSWPVQLTSWIPASPGNFGFYDAVSKATPLGLLKDGGAQAVKSFSSIDSLSSIFTVIVNIGMSPGQIPVIPLLLGGIYLLYKQYISFHIPLSFIGSLGIFTSIFWFINPIKYATPFFHLATGGLMIGAFFMATDYVTSPMTEGGMIIFGTGCGLLTGIIRLLGGYPEGVSFAILFMNALTPLIDRYTETKE